MKWNTDFIIRTCFLYFILILSFKINFFCGLCLYLFLLSLGLKFKEEKNETFTLLEILFVETIMFCLIPYYLSIL